MKLYLRKLRKMESSKKVFEVYTALSPTDEQVVFRDVMKRLYTPIVNNWCNLRPERMTKPDKEYTETFDLTNREVIDYIVTMEYRTMLMLNEAGIIEGLGKYHHELKSPHFRFDKPIVYFFSFETCDPQAFSDLYNQIFVGSALGEVDNPRDHIRFDEIGGKLRLKGTDKILIGVQYGKKPSQILRKLFIDGKDTVYKNEFVADEIGDDVKMKHILKQKVYTSFLEIGADYVRLKAQVSRNELEKYAK